jgi:hypothetical protein
MEQDLKLKGVSPVTIRNYLVYRGPREVLPI